MLAVSFLCLIIVVIFNWNFEGQMESGPDWWEKYKISGSIDQILLRELRLFCSKFNMLYLILFFRNILSVHL